MAIERAGILVRAAERLFPDLLGAEKKAWVTKALYDRGITLDVNMIEAIIRDEVDTMRAELGMLPGEKE